MKRPKLDSFDVVAIGIIAIAVALRVVMVTLGWPPVDSDEGIMGIMGMHIAFHGDWPVFLYGNGYLGATEAYLGAIFFHLFGVSAFSLRLGLIIIYVLFMAAMYALTRLLYERSLALITVVVLALGSNSELTRELVAVGGDPETLMLGALLMLLVSWLAITSKRDVSAFTMSERRRRFFAFSAWGLFAGLGIWIHLLITPFVLVGGLLIVIFCWRELVGWPVVSMVVFLVVGMLPMVLYNINVAPGQDTLSYLFRIHSVSGLGITLPPPYVLIAMQLRGAFLISLPIATGLTPLCAPQDIQLFSLQNAHVVLCSVWHTGWSLGVVALWLLAVASALREWLLARAQHEKEDEHRAAFARQMARLALLAAAALTFLAYVISPNAALFPIPTSRYLVGLLVTTPTILWPLWHRANLVKPLVWRWSTRYILAQRLSRLNFFLRRGTLALIGIVMLIGTQSIFTGIPVAPPVEQKWGVFAIQVDDQHMDLAASRAFSRQQDALIQDLLKIHATHIYSDYWTCNRLIFGSEERIICSVLKDNLDTGQNRYLPYQGIVSNDQHAARVFPLGSPQDRLFASIAARSHGGYHRYIFDGYVVYRPVK